MTFVEVLEVNTVLSCLYYSYWEFCNYFLQMFQKKILKNFADAKARQMSLS